LHGVTVFAAGTADAAVAFIEIGAVVLVMAVLGRLAGRLQIPAVPFYLIAGLAVGNGGFVELRVSEEFISLSSEIGVLLLLLALGLEYDRDELRSGLTGGVGAGVVDMVANALPGLALGFVLGWDWLACVLLGGATWVSSSGIVAKILRDLDRLAFRETPSVLNLLVIEDLAMAIYLPVVAALVVGGSAGGTSLKVLAAVGAVTLILVLALRFGGHLTRIVGGGSDETLLLAIFGLTLLVAGLAQSIDVSGAIGAFLVGLAVSGQVGARAIALISPLRDLFAATFFLFFSFQIDPSDLAGVVAPAAVLAVVTAFTKIVSGWYAAARNGIGPGGRMRAGTALVARGEFSVVIAALGAGLVDGPELGALVAAYVLILAVAGPVMARFADQLPRPGVTNRVRSHV
jgi:CPA2 family monovalent cation:H+ antiporter-2